MSYAAPAPLTSVEAIFPSAPANAAPPESASAVYKVHMRNWKAANGTWVWIWLAATVVVPAALVVTVGLVVALVALGVALIPPIVVLALQWGKASDAYWDAYAAARGLEHHEGGGLHAEVPLLRKGDKRRVHRTVRGPVGGDEGTIALYTYTDISTDSDGDRQETDYDFTLVVFRLPAAVAARFRGVYLRRSGLTLGKLQDKLSHDRGVELESTDFNKCFDLRVSDEQDDIALYELFSTTFIDFLCQVRDVQWEQVGESLVVFRKGHCQNTAELDQLCGKAAAIHRRYCEEDR